jgi:hypothetical protein
MEAAMGASLVTILVATVASWIFGAAWYGTLARPWMAAAGLTEEDVKGPNGKPNLTPYLISFVCEFVMAYLLAVLLLHTSDGSFSLGTALFSAFLIWLGFVFTTQLVNHQYSMRPLKLTAIDTGHWLGVLLVQAAVMALIGL